MAIAILLIALNTLAQVKIGAQTWATKNLDVTTFRNGDPIPEAKTDGEWKAAAEAGKPAWCYYDNDFENGKIYGKLYNWYAVNDPRGLASSGWHVPNNMEWKILVTYLGKDDAGKKMKASSGWRKNGNGTDSNGFAAMPGGSRGDEGSFGNNVGLGTFWWSATEYGDTDAWSRNVSFSEDGVSTYGVTKGIGESVRCIKD